MAMSFPFGKADIFLWIIADAGYSKKEKPR